MQEKHRLITNVKDVITVDFPDFAPLPTVQRTIPNARSMN